jgi:NOL1/NOP2/fmu family ribosome biogenesis protein
LLKGRDIALSREEFEKLRQKGEKTGFKILKNNEEFIGTGKLTEEGRIVNYMPKERRLR